MNGQIRGYHPGGPIDPAGAFDVVADADNVQRIEKGIKCWLDGWLSSSTGKLVYTWQQIVGTTVELSSYDQPLVSFTAPVLTGDGIFTHEPHAATTVTLDSYGTCTLKLSANDDESNSNDTQTANLVSTPSMSVSPSASTRGQQASVKATRQGLALPAPDKAANNWPKWDLGDGAMLQGCRVNHAFANAGTYTVWGSPVLSSLGLGERGCGQELTVCSWSRLVFGVRSICVVGITKTMFVLQGHTGWDTGVRNAKLQGGVEMTFSVERRPGSRISIDGACERVSRETC